MIPGKTYTPDDILQIALRRKWLIIAPFVIITAAGFVVAKMLPNQYRSETLILVVPQRVPESYVRATVTARIEDRLQSISQQILSRPRLERIVQEFDLYAELRGKVPIERLIQRMRTTDIVVETVKGDAFRVSYASTDRYAAMRVTERLASLFIEENLRDREVLAEDTNQFLETQLGDARRRLVEHEKKLEEYRRQYSGELPSQLQSNLQVIQNAQLQVQALLQSLSRDYDRRSSVERSLTDLKSSDSPDDASHVATVGDPALTEASAADRLQAAREALRTLQLRLKPSHPDVVAMTRTIRDLEAAANAAGKASSAPAPGTPLTRAAIARRARLAEAEAELESLVRQIAAKETEERRLRGVIATYQARVEAGPTRESEMVALTRDYETLRQIYTGLLTKNEDSKVAANLERRQIGEQFRILDPAGLPQTPFSPDRMRITLLGAMCGLALGLGLVALLEYRDTTLRSDDDVVAALALPVLAMIPAMMTTRQRRRRLRTRWILSLTAAATCIAGVAFVIWKLGV